MNRLGCKFSSCTNALQKVRVGNSESIHVGLGDYTYSYCCSHLMCEHFVWGNMKKRISKIVGVISDEVVEKYKLYDYRNQEY